jgi:branched-chain amino acid transport system substrate-binding protein
VTDRHRPRAARSGLGSVATAVVIGLLAASCSSSGHSSATPTTAHAAPSVAPSTTVAGDTTGITASTITIGQIDTNSGPFPGGAQKSFDALKAFVAYTNSRGGVDGRQLKLVQEDDGFNCNTYTNDLRGLAGSAFASVGNFALLDACGLSVLKATPTFPDIQGYVLDGALLDLPNVTAPSPAPYGYPTTGAVWIKQKFPQDIAHTASLYVAAEAASANGIASAYQAEGFVYVYKRGIAITETNFTADVLRMKAAGVRIVDLGAMGAPQVADFIGEADQQNFHPDAIVSAVAYDPSLFKLIGAANADNVYMPLAFPLFLGQDLATNPELATMTNWMDKAHPGEVPDLYAVTAWAAGDLFVQALRSAGANPTRSSFLTALDGISHFDANGLLPPTDPGQKQGATCMVVVGVNRGQFVRLDPATKGFECNGTYNHITASQATG